MRAGCHGISEAADGYYAMNRRYYPDGKFSMELVWIPHRMSKQCRTRDRNVLAECQGCQAPLDPETGPFRGVYAPISLRRDAVTVDV